MKKTIAFITDMHLAEELPVKVDQFDHWKRVLADVAEKQIDEIVIGGDISDASYYPNFFADLAGYEGKYHIVPGNHDVVPKLLQHFPNPETPDLAELYYSFTDDNFLYLFLDSSSGEISEPQMRWLVDKIENNTRKILVFIHHPIFPVNTYVDRKYALKDREPLLDLFEDQRHEVYIFCGHYHCEDEIGRGAVSQHTTTAVSYQARKNTADFDAHAHYFGYRLITIESGNARNELVLIPS